MTPTIESETTLASSASPSTTVFLLVAPDFYGSRLSASLKAYFPRDAVQSVRQKSSTETQADLLKEFHEILGEELPVLVLTDVDESLDLKEALSVTPRIQAVCVSLATERSGNPLHQFWIPRRQFDVAVQEVSAIERGLASHLAPENVHRLEGKGEYDSEVRKIVEIISRHCRPTAATPAT